MDSMVDNKGFDILSYLNDMYMARIAPTIDVERAGGYHNIHDNENDAKEEISENNKKRINIPNAEIKHFQVEQERDFEEYDEPANQSSSDEPTGKDGTGHNEVFDEKIKTGGFGGSYTENVVKISENNPTKRLITSKQNTTAEEVFI